MNGTLGRVSLVAFMCLGVAGAASAREPGAGDRGFKGKGFGKGMAMPHYNANTRVSGPEQPYAWPVADRYRPVSKPYYGRAY